MKPMPKVLLFFLTVLVLVGLGYGSFVAYNKFIKPAPEQKTDLVSFGAVVTNISDDKQITVESGEKTYVLAIDNYSYVVFSTSHPDQKNAVGGYIGSNGVNILDYVKPGDKVSVTGRNDGAGNEFLVANMMVSK